MATKKPAGKAPAKKKTPVGKIAPKFRGEITQDEKGTFWLSCVTPPGRVMFPSVLKPALNYAGQELKKSGQDYSDKKNYAYKVTCLWPKSDPVAKDMVKKVNELMKTAFPDTDPILLNNPIKDGDVYYNDDPENREHYKGCYYMQFARVATLSPVAVVDSQGDEILTKEDFYAGCFARCQGSFKTYFRSVKNQGVTFYWNLVRKVADGERIGYDATKYANEDVDKAESEDDYTIDENGNVIWN